MRWMSLALLVGCVEPPVEDTDVLTGACEPTGPSQALQALPNAEDPIGGSGLLTGPTAWLLLAERATPDGVEIATWRTTNEGQTWVESVPLGLVSDRYVGNLSTVSLAGEQWLYFQSANGLNDVPILWRTRWDDGHFAPVEAVRPLLDAGGWNSRPLMWSDGGAVWAAYRNVEGVPSIAAAADGLLFSAVTGPVTEPQDNFIVGTFGDGTILAVWQTRDGPALLSQTIGDGWTTPRTVSSQFEGVRDVRALFVERNRIDLYYRTDTGIVRRRPVFGQGGSSPEQTVNTGFAADAGLPVPHRMPDCRILLTVTTEPDDPEAPLGVLILDRDAPVR